MHTFVIFFLLLLTLVLTGCEQVTDRVLKDYRVSFDPETLELKPGETKEVKLIISVTTGVDVKAEETLVKVYEKPDFLTVQTETIPGGLNDGKVTITASETAPLGDTKVTLETSKAELGRRADLNIKVIP